VLFGNSPHNKAVEVPISSCGGIITMMRKRDEDRSSYSSKGSNPGSRSRERKSRSFSGSACEKQEDGLRWTLEQASDERTLARIPR